MEGVIKVEKKRAAAYCRVSTDKEDQLNSLSAQREYFQTHMTRNGYEMVAIYADEGITGTKKRNRKEFQRMLKDAQKERFDILFVKDVSRFARNTVDSLESLRMLKDHNIDIVFINNQGILETSSELIFTIMSAMAQEESVNMSKRVKFGKEQNAKKGRVPNLVYGYDKVPGEYFNLYINEEEAAVVRRIFRMYTEDGEGCLAIAKILNAEGRRTKRGCAWSQNAVARIIRNEIYIGKVVNGKEATKEIYSSKRIKKQEEDWIVIENPHLRIIDDEVYDKAQNILHNRYDAFHIKKERQSNRYLFSTLIKCKHCHRSFRRVERKWKYGYYVRWVCSSRNGDGIEACQNLVKIEEDELLAEIISYLETWINNKALIIEEAKKQYEMFNSEMSNDFAIQDLQREAKRLQAKLDKMQELFLNDIITMEELRGKSFPVKKQLMNTEDKLKRLKQSDYSKEEIEAQLNNMFSDIRKILNSETVTNEMLKRIIEKIEVDDKGNVEVFLKRVDN